jgi:hypothetical protein
LTPLPQIEGDSIHQFESGIFDRFSALSSTEGPGINDARQVVFLAILADGRRGVFVVEPTTLPTQIP